MIVMGPGFLKSLPAINQVRSLVRSLVVQTAGGELLCKVLVMIIELSEGSVRVDDDHTR